MLVCWDSQQFREVGALGSDMDRFVEACDMETERLRVKRLPAKTDMQKFIAQQDKQSRWSRGLERLKSDEYIPEQQSFTRPPGASVRRVGGKWVVRERTPSLKPAQRPQR